MTSASPSPDRPLVLVVDDAHAVRLMMSRTLTEAGYHVLSAPDGQSAINVLLGHRLPPDLVVTDLRMPGVDGEALAAWLATHYPSLPVAFVSGFPAEALEELPGPLLKKPFTPAALCGLVQGVLAQRPRASAC
jgi:two-component system, cell cycle sensor histidine kinase and response regulator CckA